MKGWTAQAAAAEDDLASQLFQELLLVHSVLECLAAVDENYGDFVVELTAQLFIPVDVNLSPYETASPGQLHDALFHDFTQVTALAGVNQDLARYVHQAGV